MARTLELQVLNPAETLLEVSEAMWVHLQLVDGTGITVYPGHAPLLAETVTTALRYADRAGEHAFQVEAGILQVGGDRVTVFTSSQSEAEAATGIPTTSGERQFERLARELQTKLQQEEPDDTLGGLLEVAHE